MGLNCHLLKCQFGEYIFPQRYIICIMALLGVSMSYNLRDTINIALIRMVTPDKLTDKSKGHQCTETSTDKDIVEYLTGGTLPWTEKQQGFIISAFFPGYVITQIFGATLADRFGAKTLFNWCIFLSGITSILTPLAISLGGWQLFAVLRAFMGLCLGAIITSVFTIMAKWVPSKEHGILGTIITSGTPLGHFFSLLGTTALISKSNSWKLPFYVWGVVSITWCKLFYHMCFSEPSQNPFMSENEIELLEQELGGHRNNTKFKIPWIKIFTCKPVWAMIVCKANVIKSNVTTNKSTAALPQLVLFISAIASGWLSDLLIRKDIMSIRMCRKVFCGFGGILPALFLILMPYMGCSGKQVSAMIFMCHCSMGPMYASLVINSTDLSINFSGTITSIATSLGTLLYFPVPNIAAALVENQTFEQWRIVMWMIGTIGMTSTAVFLVWGSSDRQDFDTID